MSEILFNFAPFYDFIARVSASHHYHKFVEIGVHRGDSVLYLADKLREIGQRFIIGAVDPWEQSKSEDTYPLTNASVRMEFEARIIQKNLSASLVVLQKTSLEAADSFDDKSLDFVFIDANHSYAHVKADINAWLPKMRVNGILAGHDYTEPCGVKQAVDELLPGRVSLMGSCWYTFIK